MFEIYIINGRTYINNLICYIDADVKIQPSSFDNGSSGGGNSLPYNSTT